MFIRRQIKEKVMDIKSKRETMPIFSKYFSILKMRQQKALFKVVREDLSEKVTIELSPS